MFSKFDASKQIITFKPIIDKIQARSDLGEHRVCIVLQDSNLYVRRSVYQIKITVSPEEEEEILPTSEAKDDKRSKMAKVKH